MNQSHITGLEAPFQNLSTTESEDLTQRLARYGDHFEVHKAVRTSFDVSMYLSKFEDFLMRNMHQLNFCFRKAVCKCTDQNNCDCDDDLYFPVTTASTQTCSNCKYDIDLVFKHKLKAQPKKVMRFFTISDSKDGDVEKPVFDIGKDTCTIYEPSYVKFSIVDCRFAENTLHTSFDYMSFDETPT